MLRAVRVGSVGVVAVGQGGVVAVGVGSVVGVRAVRVVGKLEWLHVGASCRVGSVGVV